MENFDINFDAAFKEMGRRASLHPTSNRRRVSIRNSISGRLSLMSDSAAPTADSADDDWDLIQMGMQEVSKLTKEVDEEFDNVMYDDDEDCVKALTFNSPGKHRMSLGTIEQEREKVNLLKRSVELDEEDEFMDDYITAMNQNFMLMFTEVTKRRLNLSNGTNKDVDLYAIINSVHLEDQPVVEWASILEKAVEKAMQ